MKIALLQFDCVEERNDENRGKVAAAVAEAEAAGAEILALPELWCSGYDLAAATRRGGWERDFPELAELSRRHGIAILGGSLLEAQGERYSNCAVAFEAGTERGRYRKQHLFKPLLEHRYLVAGNERPRIFSLRGLRCAMTICYDLRFPEVFRPLAVAGVELIHVPAQWPRQRIHHWRALLVARAIESQCWIVGVNRRGWYADREFPGHSLVVDPRGEIVLDAGEEPGVRYAAIDRDLVVELRRSFPVLEDRREDLYPPPHGPQ